MARRLKTLMDVRRYLADLVLRLEAGTISETKARTAGYLSNILKTVIESSDIESRLQKLEETVGRGITTP
jgi:hypothetical protein